MGTRTKPNDHEDVNIGLPGSTNLKVRKSVHCH